MTQQNSFNLFIYGTLMSPSVFRAVLGRRLVTRSRDADGIETFQARSAILDGYKKISPDNTYLYAVPAPQGRIRGYVIGLLPRECLASLLKYEGQNYSRRTLDVQTKDGIERAVVFVGNLKQWDHSFGYRFRDNLKQEILLQQKIDAALLEAEREQLHTDESYFRRAVGELRGPKIRDLVRRHFDAGGISDYAIRQSLKDDPLRDFSRILKDPEANALASNYLSMVVRQIIFNQIEDRIRKDFRYELDHMGLRDDYYERTVSSLAALRIINSSGALIYVLLHDCLSDLSFQANHLVDYVRWAIIAADSIYDSRKVRQQIEFIRNHSGRGYLPMGAELEFSNIGQDVIRDPAGTRICDISYDGFLYFTDFALDILTWKLGGHIDDHHEKASLRPRRGFFEVALGSLSIEGNLSKPLTDDPWLLSQFIHETRRFYNITPHSVHISFQLRSQHRRPVRDRMMPTAVMKCLFAIAGDPVRSKTGSLQMKRLVSDEIISTAPYPYMLFSEISMRRSSDSDELYAPVTSTHSGRYVQQFKFLRLTPELNYEPIIMALKGLQLSLSPGTFLKPIQYRASRKHRKRFEELLAWGADAQSISASEIKEFLGCVREGLMSERRGKPAHTGAYIAWSISQLRSMLKNFNALASGRTLLLQHKL